MCTGFAAPGVEEVRLLGFDLIGSPGTRQLAEEFEVSGRGELHLSVLMETMRREGYEFCVSRPRVIVRDGPNGREEPYENLVVQTDSEYSGAVIDKLGRRMGELTGMQDFGNGRAKLEFKIPARGLIGYRSEFLTDTRGTGIMASVFAGYGPRLGSRKTRPLHIRRRHREGQEGLPRCECGCIAGHDSRRDQPTLKLGKI